jgi:hypothetical protein
LRFSCQWRRASAAMPDYRRQCELPPVMYNRFVAAM